MKLPAAIRKAALDRRLLIDGRSVRFFESRGGHGIDEEALRFESALRARIEIPVYQSLAYVSASHREFRILQLAAVDGTPNIQIVLHIRRPKRLQGAGRAFALRLTGATTSAAPSSSGDEILAFGLIRRLCAEAGDLLTLRLQPWRENPTELDTFETRASVAGYEPVCALEYTRTLRYDLSRTSEVRLSDLSKKTRAKLRRTGRDAYEIRRIDDPKFIVDCRTAQRASFGRSGAEPACFDFEAAFELARRAPDQAAIFGFFLADQPSALMAYVIGFRSGLHAEYVSAGSCSNDQLRKYSFNYLLLWELLEWAAQGGAQQMDLGGITPGGVDDSRASISQFKRHLSEDEIEVGREVMATLQPMRALLFDRLVQLKNARQDRPLRLVGGLLASLGIFAAVLGGLSASGRLGSPESPAWARLRATPRMPEIAVIGDSRPHTGISPRVLTETLASLGVPAIQAHNFAVDGTDVLHHYSFAAHGLLQGWAVPRLLIWAPNPLQFSAARRNNRLEQLPIHDLPVLARSGAPLEMLLDLATMFIFRPYRDRPLIEQRIFEDYASRAAARTLPIQNRVLGLEIHRETLSRRYTEKPDGQEPYVVLNEAGPAGAQDRFERGAKAYARDYATLQLSDLHFNMARQLMVRAREAGSQLLVVELPVAPQFQQSMARTPVHLEWRRRLSALAEQEGAAFVSDAAYFAGPGDDARFGDPGHMPESTAEEYSRGLGRTIADSPVLRQALLHAGRR